MYFENIILLQNTLLSYFSNEYPLKLINKKFSTFNYEKYNTHIQPHGIIEIYNINTKTLDERENYKNGKLDGLYESFHENNKLAIRSNYKNGKLDGLYEEWWDNGQLATKSNYKNGELNGLWERWWDNGILWENKNYKNGELDGLQEYFYDNGILGHRNNYRDRKLDKFWY